MGKDMFEYVVPYRTVLDEMYETPYDFSEELKQAVYDMFTSPKANPRHYKYFYDNFDDKIARDMLKQPYKAWMYYKEHKHQFNNDPCNLAPQMITSMGKSFISIIKNARGAKPGKYMKIPVARMKHMFCERVLPLLVKERPRLPSDLDKRKPMELTRVYKEVTNKVEYETYALYSEVTDEDLASLVI